MDINVCVVTYRGVVYAQVWYDRRKPLRYCLQRNTVVAINRGNPPSRLLVDLVFSLE